MKNKTVLFTSIAVAATVAVVSLGSTIATSVPSFAHGTSGSAGGEMGGPMGGHGMKMGQKGHRGGMMGGNGHMGGHTFQALDLDVDDVRKIIEGRLVMHGSDRLKVGKVEVVNDETIKAEIVTVDDSLVFMLEFDHKTGAHHPIR